MNFKILLDVMDMSLYYEAQGTGFESLQRHYGHLLIITIILVVIITMMMMIWIDLALINTKYRR